MYQTQYTSNPTITLNPFTDSLEALVAFRSNKEFLDSLSKAIVDAGGNPQQVVRPDVTLTELMNTLAINGVRFIFDPLAKKGSDVNIEVKPEVQSTPQEPSTEQQ